MSQISPSVPKGLSPLLLSLVVAAILVPIILTAIDIVRTKKQKKTLYSKIVYDNQTISIAIEAQREPWKDRDGLPIFWSGDEYFDFYEWERSVNSNRIFTFCNRISLNLRNEGSLSIDTDVCKEPLVFKIDVRGKLSNTKVLAIKPANPKLELGTMDGMVKLEHLHLEPMESLLISFFGYFVVHLEELF